MINDFCPIRVGWYKCAFWIRFKTLNSIPLTKITTFRGFELTREPRQVARHLFGAGVLWIHLHTVVTVSDVTPVFLSQTMWSVSPTLQCGLEASRNVSSRSYLSHLTGDLTFVFSSRTFYASCRITCLLFLFFCWLLWWKEPDLLLQLNYQTSVCFIKLSHMGIYHL